MLNITLILKTADEIYQNDIEISKQTLTEISVEFRKIPS